MNAERIRELRDVVLGVSESVNERGVGGDLTKGDKADLLAVLDDYGDALEERAERIEQGKHLQNACEQLVEQGKRNKELKDELERLRGEKITDVFVERDALREKVKWQGERMEKAEAEVKELAAEVTNFGNEAIAVGLTNKELEAEVEKGEQSYCRLLDECARMEAELAAVLDEVERLRAEMEQMKRSQMSHMSEHDIKVMNGDEVDYTPAIRAIKYAMMAGKGEWTDAEWRSFQEGIKALRAMGVAPVAGNSRNKLVRRQVKPRRVGEGGGK